MEWDETYLRTAQYFGAGLEPLARDYLPSGEMLRILDIGAGQGRNAIPLAKAGHSLTAIDPSEVAARQVTEFAAREGLQLTAWVGDFTEYHACGAVFDAVLAIGLVPILTRDGINALRLRIGEWLTPGGRLLLTAFTVDDPSFDRCRAEWQEAARNSFVSERGSVRTFLERGEVLRLFKGYTILHHWEGLGGEHRHGDGPVHQHGLVELVAIAPAVASSAANPRSRNSRVKRYLFGGLGGKIIQWSM
jgi:tellurite methyltransferase